MPRVDVAPTIAGVITKTVNQLPTTGKRPVPPQLVGKNFQKGHVANPNGRPKIIHNIRETLNRLAGDPVPETIAKKLAEVFPKANWKRMTIHEALMLRVLLEGLAGQDWALRFYSERTNGKVSDELKVSQSGSLQIVEELVSAPSAPLKLEQPAEPRKASA